MDDDQIEATALAIADAHGCHTVILYGSHTRGDAQPGSDVDLLCLRDGGAEVRDARVIEGVTFDAFVQPGAALDKPDVGLLRILGGRVLRERDGGGSALLERVRARFEQGPEPLAADDRTVRIVWAHKMLDRIRRDEGVNAHYRRMALVVQSLEDYFALRRLWFRGSKVAFPWLLAHDEETHRAFEAALRPTADGDALTALVRAVYGPLPD
jgi:hypothetical protein